MLHSHDGVISLIIQLVLNFAFIGIIMFPITTISAFLVALFVKIFRSFLKWNLVGLVLNLIWLAILMPDTGIDIEGAALMMIIMLALFTVAAFFGRCVRWIVLAILVEPDEEASP